MTLVGSLMTSQPPPGMSKGAVMLQASQRTTGKNPSHCCHLTLPTREHVLSMEPSAHWGQSPYNITAPGHPQVPNLQEKSTAFPPPPPYLAIEPHHKRHSFASTWTCPEAATKHTPKRASIPVSQHLFLPPK